METETLVSNAELQLADQVSRPGTLGIVAVKQIQDGIVTFFRPYTHTADFSYTGGVLCYVGIEEWKEETNRTLQQWTLVSRKRLR